MSSQQNQPTPPSSTSSNGASPDNQQFRVVRKRNRIPLSCAPCRSRKLKCNRAHPCDNCTKRGDVSSCNYATPGNRKKGGAGGPNSTPEDMQNRIDRLEGLVLSLMTAGNQQGSTAAAQAAINGSRSNSLSTGSDLRLDLDPNDMIPEEVEGEGEESEVEQVSRGIGVMKMDNGKTVFASDSHWYAILNEISEVKKYFDAHKEDYKRQWTKIQELKGEASRAPSFLFQGMPPTTRQELLAAYPSKANADRLIARYFNAYDPSHHVLHGPSFQKQYDKHWLNPQDTSVMWIGMCYAMMTLALQSYHRAGDEPPEYRGRSLDLSHHYRRLTAQCLIQSDITQPIAMILETLVLHLQAEYGRSKDAEPGVLLIMSLCVRLAMRMGYHRDPGPHPGITPFQGEMRRRVFTFVRQCDLLFSFQFGMPAMIRSDQVDSQPPRNLFDDELYEEMPSLPPSRPSWDATPMSYMLAKSRMITIFGRIVERTSSLTEPASYEETMRFDQVLRQSRAENPPLLQMRPFQESARDPANLIMQRVGLEMVYLRSLFVLHRRFIARGRDNPRYAYSRRTCIDASMQLLAHQATLHREAQPGGRLRTVKWYISSLTTHDFLLAAMLVCLDLYHQSEADRKGRAGGSSASNGNNSGGGGNSIHRTSSNGFSPVTSTSPHGLEAVETSREEMMRAVEHCITIWDAVKNHSMEAYKASSALRVMLEKLKAYQTNPATATAASSSSSVNPSGGSASFSSTSQQQSSLQGQNQQQQTSQFQQQQQQQQRPKGASALENTHLGYMFDGRAGFGFFPNGTPSDMVTDDLPPEQSAAMTLGMLSSGGISPGPSFNSNSNSNNNNPSNSNSGDISGNGSGSANNAPSPGGGAKSPFPASMAALLNDPLPSELPEQQQQQQQPPQQQQQRVSSGLSPPPSTGFGSGGAASPFSTNLFGSQGGNMMGVEGMGMGMGMNGMGGGGSSGGLVGGGDIDWGAWDNYIANNSAMDPTASLWPMNLDFGSLEDNLSGMSNGADTTNSGAGGSNGTPGSANNEPTASSSSGSMNAQTAAASALNMSGL